MNQHMPPPEDQGDYVLPEDFEQKFLGRAMWLQDILNDMDRLGIRMTLEHADRLCQEQFNELVLFLACEPLPEVKAKLTTPKMKAEMIKLIELSDRNQERAKAMRARAGAQPLARTTELQ